MFVNLHLESSLRPFPLSECLLLQLRVAQNHLQQCLTRLGCSVMERERRSFLFYSQFYEQILQQQTQLLSQREQVGGKTVLRRSSTASEEDFYSEIILLLIHCRIQRT